MCKEECDRIQHMLKSGDLRIMEANEKGVIGENESTNEDFSRSSMSSSIRTKSLLWDQN